MFGQLLSFDNLVPPSPIGVATIFSFLQSHYIGMLRSQSYSFTSVCNRWRQSYCITSWTVGGSTRNGLTPICSGWADCNTCWDCTKCPNCWECTNWRNGWECTNCRNCWECTNCWNSNNSTTKEWSEESSSTTTNTRRTISGV